MTASEPTVVGNIQYSPDYRTSDALHPNWNQVTLGGLHYLQDVYVVTEVFTYEDWIEHKLRRVCKTAAGAFEYRDQLLKADPAREFLVELHPLGD